SETVKQQLKETLNNQAAILEKIFERITDAFIALDKDFRYTYINKKAQQLIRKSAEEVLGKCVWDIFPDAVGSATYDA
ncbi:PAS domain-containing protein, partial [Acinetobacter baumannii]